MDKKRSGPEPVAPVRIGNTRYESLPFGKARGLEQNGGYIVAYDEGSGRELWTLKVYNVTYDPDMEDDKQDVFITALTFDKSRHRLLIENEEGNRFAVDLVSRAVSLA